MKTLPFLILFLSALFASADHCGRSRCDWKHCERHCRRPLVVTNTVVVTVTNTVERSPILPLRITDYTIQANHVYRILYSSEGVDWHRFAVVRAKSNQVARVIQAPSNLLFQLRDVTPGFEGTVIEGREPSGDATCYLVRRKGVILKLN